MSEENPAVTRRRVLRASAVSLVASALAGCGSPGGDAGDGDGTTTVGGGATTQQTTTAEGTTTTQETTTTQGETTTQETTTTEGETTTAEETTTTTEEPTTTTTSGAVTVEDYPSVAEWLTGTEVGAADDSFDGTIADRRGQDVITVDVGAQGNQGYYAFDPSAVAVSRGTTVEWVWTGRGQAHNVVAEPAAQIGESDYQFDSGEPVAEEGTTYTQEMGQAGVALYHCEPHLVLGMKGAIVVVA